ncbi:unnamed protein product [Effrenium voratum]|nr:unnamed protein product [Effrenium voratum]
MLHAWTAHAQSARPRPVPPSSRLRSDVVQVQMTVAILFVVTLGSFVSILTDGSLISSGWRTAVCGEVWVRHGDVTLTECNGIVVSFPSVVLITSILSFATLAGLMWLSGHLLNTDMCRLGSELSRMLLVFVAIKVIFLGFHATFLALTWSSVFSHRAFSLVILILDLVLVVLAAVTWRKVLKIQDTIVATLEQEKENTRIEGLARLPQTSFLELQEVAEDAELAVTRMPRCPMHEQCVICLSDFEPSSKVTRLACGHVFHASCINIWLLDAKHKWCPYRCPEEPLRFEDV